MTTGPTTEIIVSITNIIRRSPQGQVYFAFDEDGDKRFDNWQEVILNSARLINLTWQDESTVATRALEVIEKAFNMVLTPNKETI